jgi:hypothetical protein
MKLECPKCRKPWLLSEDDAAFFYPRVFCLACGAKIDIPMEPVEHLKLLKKRDRDRRVQER